MAGWTDDAWRSGSKGCAVPLTKLQAHALRILAALRGPDSYIAGGIALNRDGPGFSEDIDIFHDSEERLEATATATADAAALAGAGLKITWLKAYAGKRQALVEGLGATMQLEWVADSDFRFFPAQPDELFGYVPHPVDLATNKTAAAADRREPRDIVDLVTIHEKILPLGAVICAAVGRFPGVSPEEMLSEITRHSRFTAEEFRVLCMERPIDVPELHRRIRRMIEDAEQFIGCVPSEAVGVVFLYGGMPVQPDPDALEKYQRHPGSRRGLWPSSSEISSAMLEHYDKAPTPRH